MCVDFINWSYCSAFFCFVFLIYLSVKHFFFDSQSPFPIPASESGLRDYFFRFYIKIYVVLRDGTGKSI